MSSFVYGRLQLKYTRTPLLATPENKFVAAIVAMIPTEVLGLHALVLAKTTTTDSHGTTTITDPAVLGAFFVVCLVFGPALYVAGRTRTGWGPKDWIKLVIPAVAFISWAGLLGTSVLTPWVAGRIDPVAVWLGAVVLGIVLILVNKFNS